MPLSSQCQNLVISRKQIFWWSFIPATLRPVQTEDLWRDLLKLSILQHPENQLTPMRQNRTACCFPIATTLCSSALTAVFSDFFCSWIYICWVWMRIVNVSCIFGIDETAKTLTKKGRVENLELYTCASTENPDASFVNVSHLFPEQSHFLGDLVSFRPTSWQFVTDFTSWLAVETWRLYSKTSLWRLTESQMTPSAGLSSHCCNFSLQRSKAVLSWRKSLIWTGL